MSKDKDKSKDKRYLTMRSSVKTLSIKCYNDQIPTGWADVQERIRNIDPSKWQVIAIKHDRDYLGDSFWTPSIEKEHYHIIVRIVSGVTKVSTILNALGIKYRKGLDDTLWSKHGVETIAKFSHMAAYLTHETEQAQLDGKEVYELTELVSNLTIDEIKQVRDGYVRVTKSTGKVSMEDMSTLDEQAWQIGYDLKDFSSWYQSLPFAVRCNHKMSTVQRRYNLGVHDRAIRREKRIRLCVFIQGKPNTGKTYSTLEALEGKRILSIGGGGTGQFDTLEASTEAIILDDDVCKNLLNMTDNYICQAYRRNNNNPYWCGQYFIVTSNHSFREWVEKCGIKTQVYNRLTKTYKDTEEYSAIRSRFYICEIQEGTAGRQLLCTQHSTRGELEVQAERYDMYKDFRDKFNKSLSKYNPSPGAIDYSDINDYII